MRLREFLQVVEPMQERIVATLGQAGTQQVQDHLRILEVVLVPAVVDRLAGARRRQARPWPRSAARWAGISEPTCFRWKERLGGLKPSELRQLEEGNAKLRRLVSDLSLDKEMLQEVIGKTLAPARAREMVDSLRGSFR